MCGFTPQLSVFLLLLLYFSRRRSSTFQPDSFHIFPIACCRKTIYTADSLHSCLIIMVVVVAVFSHRRSSAFQPDSFQGCVSFTHRKSSNLQAGSSSQAIIRSLHADGTAAFRTASDAFDMASPMINRRRPRRLLSSCRCCWSCCGSVWRCSRRCCSSRRFRRQLPLPSCCCCCSCCGSVSCCSRRRRCC